MVGLDISSNIRQFRRGLRDIERRQLPFATSQALNSTAFDVRKQWVEKTWSRSMDVRDSRFMGVAMRVKKASKRRLIARVFDRLDTGFLYRQATGGIKRPAGNSIAIPSNRLKARRGARGVPKNLRPRQALQKKKTFEARLRSGQRVIMRRKTKKRNPVEVLYVLEPRATVPPRFPAFQDGRRVALRQFGPNFGRAWRKALATARF